MVRTIDQLTTMGRPGDAPADWPDENAVDAWVTALEHHGTLVQLRRAVKQLEARPAVANMVTREYREWEAQYGQK
jgi:hypothetical protein